MTTENINQLKEILCQADDICTNFEFLLHTFRALENAKTYSPDHLGIYALTLPIQLFDEFSERLHNTVNAGFDFLHENDPTYVPIDKSAS